MQKGNRQLQLQAQKGEEVIHLPDGTLWVFWECRRISAAGALKSIWDFGCWNLCSAVDGPLIHLNGFVLVQCVISFFQNICSPVESHSMS